MDEQDLWSIELISPRLHFPNAIGKQICIDSKAPTSLGESKKTHSLQFGWSRPGFEKKSNSKELKSTDASLVCKQNSAAHIPSLPNTYRKHIVTFIYKQ
jgi:hypothetical protein